MTWPVPRCAERPHPLRAYVSFRRNSALTRQVSWLTSSGRGHPKTLRARGTSVFAQYEACQQPLGQKEDFYAQSPESPRPTLEELQIIR